MNSSVYNQFISVSIETKIFVISFRTLIKANKAIIKTTAYKNLHFKINKRKIDEKNICK